VKNRACVVVTEDGKMLLAIARRNVLQLMVGHQLLLVKQHRCRVLLEIEVLVELVSVVQMDNGNRLLAIVQKYVAKMENGLIRVLVKP
jgi:hypothetical protein